MYIIIIQGIRADARFATLVTAKISDPVTDHAHPHVAVLTPQPGVDHRAPKLRLETYARCLAPLSIDCGWLELPVHIWDAFEA